MIVIRTVVNPDPAARRNLVAVLTGPGAPAGVRRCVERDDIVSVTFDDAVAATERIDAAITLATHFVPADVPGPSNEETPLTAVGLDEPDLDDLRLRERHLVGLE